MIERVAGALDGRPCGQAVQFAHIADKILCQPVGGQAIMFGQVAHQFAQLQRLQAHIASGDHGLALLRLQQTKQELNQRAFTCAVRPQQPGTARRHGEGGAVKGHDFAIVFAQIFRPDDELVLRERLRRV